MGSVEDDEPPTKRVKVSQIRHQGSCSSLIDSMARLLASDGADEVVGSKGVIKKGELVRIIVEALYSLGYSKSAARLEKESGIPLHCLPVDSFIQQIIDGRWDESVATLHEIGLRNDAIVKLASFLILERKFLELIDEKMVMDALNTLRNEITPLCIESGRVRELSYSLFSQCNETSEGISQDTRLKSRKKLLADIRKLFPPTVIIPENRLVHLVEQALDMQRDACRFHNSSVREMSLLIDHRCGMDHIPQQTLQILRDHDDEIWFLQFSHNGKYLASSSEDRLVLIWELMDDGQMCLKHRLSGHLKPVSYISWSPDDLQILTCGVAEMVRRWDVLSGECIKAYEKNGLGFVSCGWAVDGKSFFTGVTDHSICMWDLEGTEMDCWKGQRIVRAGDLGVTSDGKDIVTVSAENMISLFAWQTNSERSIEEDQPITSFALSQDRNLLLVSLLDEEIHLWNIDDCPKLVSTYKGYRRSRFVVRCCFGGLDESFVASGSEDSQVYIWHRLSGELISKLAGHSAAVNCVSWNPANPHMLASASDDRTIRIWGLNPETSC